MQENRFKTTISYYELIYTVVMTAAFVVCGLLKSVYPDILNWLGIFVYVYAILTWKKKTNSRLFSLYFIFYSFLFLFNYGQCIMWAFGLHSPGETGSTAMFYVTGYVPSRADVADGQWYTCLSMFVFHIGALIVAKQGKDTIWSSSIVMDEEVNVSTKIAMRRVGLVCLLITTPFVLYFRASEMAIAQVLGYRSLYYSEVSTQTGFFQYITPLFFPSLVAYLIGSGYSKKSRLLGYGIYGVYVVLSAFSGYRGVWLYSLIILVWLHTKFNKVNKKKLLLYILCGFLLLYVITALRNTRDIGFGIDWNDVFSVEKSPIVSACFEMGFSMELIVFFLHAGREIYPFGNTYLVTIFGSITSRIIRLFGVEPVYIGSWFSQDYLGVSWGTGFSMIAEAYVNGGYIGGLIYLLILGLLIGKLLQYENKKDKLCSLFLSAAGLEKIVTLTRGATFYTAKQFIFGVLPIYVLICICAARYRKISN